MDTAGCLPILGILSHPSVTIKMTAHDYLLKFRKVNNLDSLEKLYDHLNYSLSDNTDIINMYRAADHRRAELVSGGRLFDLGCVPKSVWRYVV
ncbi:OriC-binding nucleoid-associated protein [Pantoea ananatis]|nr:OriC-binding nucleoid-associated protein [Pantoea ananatis]CRH38217.1 OriC-binding nucleoid-associated protein [Pantoea ananatis]